MYHFDSFKKTIIYNGIVCYTEIKEINRRFTFQMNALIKSLPMFERFYKKNNKLNHNKVQNAGL